MTCSCSHDAPAATSSPRYRRVLWLALVLNAVMFAVELAGSHHAQSLSLLADAIDFAGDAVNYGVSLAVLGAGLVWRARTAWVKAWAMLAFGGFVLGRALWSVWHGPVPEPLTMGLVGVLAMLVNVSVAAMLFSFRDGDANMRSVWVCSRNDALGNLAVVGAAMGVAGSGTAWPDLLVGAFMAGLALQGGLAVRRQARAELAAARARH
ncbi:MAG: cation transporter [Hydrogenophaga sp.]